LAELESVPTTEAAGSDGGPHDGARRALWLFVVIEAAALVFCLGLARREWFYLDEWDFLAGRGLNLHDLLHSHAGHWVTVPVVIYRLLWQVVGLRSYVPYAAVAIGAHLGAAALLRMIMRRSGVGAWTATVAASAFVFMGAGSQDILWGFQITFGGALAFGLLHVVLADHDGPFDWRDLLGLAAGLFALMCSGVGIAMAIVAGLAALLRRGWRIAALHTFPLGVVYLGWWARYGRDQRSVLDLGRIFEWSTHGGSGVFDALGQVRGVGWVLGGLLIGGLVLAARESGVRVLINRAGVPFALLVGVLVFLAITGANRGGFGPNFARSSRYMHILAALVLPAIAVAADAVIRRSRVLGTIALAALLVGVPANVGHLRNFARYERGASASTRVVVLSIPWMPLAHRVPPALRPNPNEAADVTVGWLLDGVASGRIPKPRPPSAVQIRTNILRLSLMELDRATRFPCRRLRSPIGLRLSKGHTIGIRGSVSVIQLARGHSSAPVPFGNVFPNVSRDHTLVAVAGPLLLRIAPSPPFGGALCVSGRSGRPV
jgi:hypothetical protein